MNKNRKKAKIRLKQQQQQKQLTMLNWSVIINCAFMMPNRAFGRQDTTFTLCQNAACSNKLFSLTGRLSFGEKRFDWENVKFATFFILSGRDTCTDFLPLLKYKALHCGWLRVLGCVISPKCLLDLNNSKPVSFCPWMSLFPAMFCHAGPSSLAFLAGWLILTDSDSQIQISKKRIVA